MMTDEQVGTAGLIVAITSLIVQISQWALSLRPNGHTASRAAKSGDVTVALTGVSAVCEVGHMTPSVEPLWCDTPPHTFFKACLRDAVDKIKERPPLSQ